MTNLVETIQKIQILNKAFNEKTTLDFSTRINQLDLVYEFCRENIRNLDNVFAQSFLNKIKQELLNQAGSEFTHEPTGLILVFITDQRHWCEMLYQKIILSVASQSPILILFKESTSEQLIETLNKIKNDSLFVGQVDYAVSSDETILRSVVNHPAMKGICFIGSKADLDKYSSAINKMALKKMFHSSYKNYAVVLADADLNQAAKEIAKGVLFYQGASPFAIHKIYVLESVYESFTSLLSTEIQKLESGGPGQPRQIISELFQQQVFSDQGKFVLQSKNLSFIKDLSNCSVLQQEEYLEPAVILSDVKYQYQIPKHANVSDLGQVAFVFGSQEKINKFIKDLNAEYYIFNEFYPAYDRLLKQKNYSALCDNSALGEFFSNQKTFL